MLAIQAKATTSFVTPPAQNVSASLTKQFVLFYLCKCFKCLVVRQGAGCVNGLLCNPVIKLMLTS